MDESSKTTQRALIEALPDFEAELIEWEKALNELGARVQRRRDLVAAIKGEVESVATPTENEATIAPTSSADLPTERPLTARMAALAVLETADHPLTTRQVIDAAFQRGLRPPVENPENAFAASLSYLAKRKRIFRAYRGSRIVWSLTPITDGLTALEASE